VRVLLLNPPCPDGRRFVREGRCTHPTGFWGAAWPPYTLAVIGGRLRRRGHDVRLLDAAVGQVTFRALRAMASSLEPEVALVSVSTPTFEMDLAAIAEIRAGAPRCCVGVLGVHATAMPEACLAGDGADFVIRGEPEIAAEAAVSGLEADGELAPLPGLSVRVGGRVLHGPERPPVADLSALGGPDWSLADVTRYRLPLVGRRFLSILTSRGCPHYCTFCTQHLYYGRAFRARQPAEVAREARQLRERFGVSDFFLWSECFSADREHAGQVCEALGAVGGLSWVATTRADCVDRELLLTMREAGCWLVAFGLESGSPEVLNECRKGHGAEASIRAVRWAKEVGLLVVGHFVFGLPGETVDTARQTTRLALEAGLDFAQFYCAAPYPGTPLYEALRSSPQGRAVPLAAVNQEQACLGNAAALPAAVARWRRRAIRRFYLRPHSVALALRLLRARFTGQSPLALRGSARPAAPAAHEVEPSCE
jgi:anaerobic magnesium-protoporphyrin IX monomethyl ester cyclase